jgi:excisionase family DNA binding protein
MSDETNFGWQPDAPLMFTKRQSSLLLSLSLNTISNLIKTKQLVARKVGSKVLIPRSSIEAFTRRDHRTGEEGRKHRAKAKK